MAGRPDTAAAEIMRGNGRAAVRTAFSFALKDIYDTAGILKTFWPFAHLHLTASPTRTATSASPA